MLPGACFLNLTVSRAFSRALFRRFVNSGNLKHHVGLREYNETSLCDDTKYFIVPFSFEGLAHFHGRESSFWWRLNEVKYKLRTNRI